MSKNKCENKPKRISIGGQALMEGIMMRGPKGASMSLRLADGSIETQMKEVHALKDKFKPAGWPMIRGAVGFVESMIFGYKCLMESAEKTALGDDGEENPEEMSKLDKWLTDHLGPKLMGVLGAISMVFGFALAFLLFFWLPSFSFDKLNQLFDGAMLPLKTVFEGIIRIIILVSYMTIVSRLGEIKRLFMYHGAEHKCIFCFESGEELMVDNVRKNSRFHPRCSTSFIFVMIILSILISSILAALVPWLVMPEHRVFWIMAKLLLMPLIMSIGYEFIRYAGAHNNIFVRILSTPGLWMQRITTQEPTDDIIEVGIAAIKAALYGIEAVEPAKEETPAEDAAEPEKGQDAE